MSLKVNPLAVKSGDDLSSKLSGDCPVCKNKNWQSKTLGGKLPKEKTPDKTSRKDEIIAVLRKHEVDIDSWTVGVFSPFTQVATEIEKLFSKCNAEWFKKGQNSVRRRNKSGCSCMFDENENEIISVCGAHQDWHDELMKSMR